MEELANLLKKYRESKELSIEQVSEKTKIRKFVLSTIETGDFSNLPPVYGKSFIKTYIDFLQIPDEEYKELFEEVSKQFKSVKSNYNPIQHADYGNLKGNSNLFGIEITPQILNYSIYSAIVIIFSIILYITIFDSSSDSEDIVENPDTPVESIKIEDITNDEDAINYSALDSIVLEAFAIDSAWIKVDMDGNNIDQVLMTPNMKKQWKAKEFFIVHQGNIGGLEIKRNGKMLEPFGSPGRSVKNVKVTRERVIYQ